MSEYAVAAALIAVGAVFVFKSFGQTILSKINELNAKVGDN